MIHDGFSVPAEAGAERPAARLPELRSVVRPWRCRGPCCWPAAGSGSIQREAGFGRASSMTVGKVKSPFTLYKTY